MPALAERTRVPAPQPRAVSMTPQVGAPASGLASGTLGKGDSLSPCKLTRGERTGRRGCEVGWPCPAEGLPCPPTTASISVALPLSGVPPAPVHRSDCGQAVASRRDGHPHGGEPHRTPGAPPRPPPPPPPPRPAPPSALSPSLSSLPPRGPRHSGRQPARHDGRTLARTRAQEPRIASSSPRRQIRPNPSGGHPGHPQWRSPWPAGACSCDLGSGNWGVIGSVQHSVSGFDHCLTKYPKTWWPETVSSGLSRAVCL